MLKRLVSALTILAVVPTAATADVSAHDRQLAFPVEHANLSTLFNRAFFTHTGNFYDAVSMGSQLNTILGFESFPETQIVQDAELLNTLLQESLAQQVTSGPLLRTPDLDNPFDTSLRSNPNYLSTDPAGTPPAP